MKISVHEENRSLNTKSLGGEDGPFPVSTKPVIIELSRVFKIEHLRKKSSFEKRNNKWESLVNKKGCRLLTSVLCSSKRTTPQDIAAYYNSR